ncbi:hypothetical protein [Saccharopolyspora pogona]|uniref:hypothetical protein n=1 Tax=Saccharopolyspora pogona TaxID=333966 RepID=UPI001682F4A2|nr:hypothetical protein [Saccharopolyspora pogona]
MATDIGDALLLGSLKPEPPTRSTLATLAAGRGLLSALIGLTIRSGPPDEAAELGGEEAHRRDLHEHYTPERSWPLRDWVSGIVDEELRRPASSGDLDFEFRQRYSIVRDSRDG